MEKRPPNTTKSCEVNIKYSHGTKRILGTTWLPKNLYKNWRRRIPPRWRKTTRMDECRKQNKGIWHIKWWSTKNGMNRWLLVQKPNNQHSQTTKRISRCFFMRLQGLERTCRGNGRNEDLTYSTRKTNQKMTIQVRT
jgi:hypothetical protein